MSSSQLKPKNPCTEEEQKALAAKLDAGFEEYLATLIDKNKDKTEEERDADLATLNEELEGHPAFLSPGEEIDFSKPLHPAVEGLMAMKYETENPSARANSYKEDGNDNFKKKRYRIAIKNYTEAITTKSPDRLINAVCYTNRAAAQFHRGNYRSSLTDCTFARKFKPDHWKAIVRGVDCCMKLRKYTDAIQWVDAALLLEPEQDKLLVTRSKAVKYQTEKERDERKQAAKERREEAEENKLIKIIQDRGITLDGLKKASKTSISPLLFNSLEAHNPAGKKVFVDDSGTMFWPVMFFYPEYGQTDFIEALNEHDILADHIIEMFNETPLWDEDRKYTPERIEVFFEDRRKEQLHKVNTSSTLLQILRHERFTVQAGTPGFIILSAGSKCWTDFLKKYNFNS